MITADSTASVPASFLACASCLLPARAQPVRSRDHPGAMGWGAPPRGDSAEGVLLSPLTPAERRVLALVLTGLADKEIAAALGRALPTVKHQVGAVLRKHGTHSRARLIALLREFPEGVPEPVGTRQCGSG